ncbi:hypothetical protein [Bosea sp. (in: a-proteobacteria)]|uniref:hypothetical protein n=1 Tax=Bosea sp. (in: a-proteobacteria) TaxID=1871050 RepID=UPI002736A1DF|nr:hypothetical protein [Bosea sp. (in: a-proteobacteria)]MDP3257825.1 hypothetical protein [Bosea sp. (in: a-proteobacteria)]
MIVFDAEGGVNFDESDKTIAGHGGRLSSLPGACNTAETVTLRAPYADTVPAAGVDDLPSKLESERIRLNFEALLLKLRFERESAQVAEIEDVAATVLAELASVRERLATIGPKVAPRLARMSSAELIKSAIDAEVVAALEDLTAG